jgi:hypothetical protein
MLGKKGIILSFIISLPLLLLAQKDTIKYEVGMLGVTSTGASSPFWMQSKSYGKIASAAQSLDAFASLSKNFGAKSQLFDYGFKANLLLQTYDKKTNIYFHELYAKFQYTVFDFVIGTREELLGNQDSSLSCGGFLFSQNARPMPKISIGIERFTAFPFTGGYLEIKGALVHGWFTDNIYTQHALLHHKYAYIKLGGKLPVHIQYGLDHVAQWSGVDPVYGQQPSSLHDYVNIFFGKSGGQDANRSDQINVLGNHIISQSMKLDVDISEYKIAAYWQNISEDGPFREIWNTMNIPDGLWGISIRNRNFPYVKGILYEYLNTTDQSGPYHDRDGVVYGGKDSYFYNGGYPTGWTYYLRTIGTPFITPPKLKNGIYSPTNFRVQAHHIGIEGDINSYNYKFMTTLSYNYGVRFMPPYDEMIQNTSMLLELNKIFPTLFNVELGCSVGADFGKLYGNSVGFQVSIKKSGSIFKY